MKMKKCFGKTHSVVQLLLILWMTSLIDLAVGLNATVSPTNDPISGNTTVRPTNDPISGNTTVRPTNDPISDITTNGLTTEEETTESGTTEGFTSDMTSTALPTSDITTNGLTTEEETITESGTTEGFTSDMTSAALPTSDNTTNGFFSCSGSNRIVSVMLVCDGYFNCDNYEDESLCNNSATYLEEGESHYISFPYTYTRRLYNATLLQTNATNGFRVIFQYLYIEYDVEVQIGTGNDPSDDQTVITTIHGYREYADDVYVDTNEMWFAVIGAKSYSSLEMNVEIMSIDLSTLFACSSSNMNVSQTVLCDGFYHCNHFEDELACSTSATYLEEGESHNITLPYTYIRRLYNATLLQTNATNGFQVVFQYLYLDNYGDDVRIGTGNDPSDNQSVITTIHGYTSYAPDDVYVDTNEMWFAVIGGRQYSGIQMDVRVTAIDLLNFFPCLGSNMSVSVTLVCDGYYNCDNYEDESLCNYSATYLEEGESHYITLTYPNTRRLYNATFLQTNSMNGFRVIFQYLYLNYDVEVQIGTGNDPSDNQSVITTIHGYEYYAPDDVYVGHNEMWFAVIGAKGYSSLEMDVEIISIDLLTLFACSSSNMIVSSTVICDGLYHCDHYEDELACNNSATYLEEGESHYISLPYTERRRLYNATLLQTNATNGFQVVFQDLNLDYSDEVQIGTGNDPSDIQSVITTIHGRSFYAPDDVYVDTNEMWVAVIGGKQNSGIQMDVRVTAIDLLNFFSCSRSNMDVSVTLVCDGYYNCDNYEDESLCNYSATYLEEGESHFISLLYTNTRRFYNATLLQTNATNGFQVAFQDFYVNYGDETVQVGTGHDPSDIQSVITTIHGYTSDAPADDVYVDTNEMWFAVIGGRHNSGIQMDVRVTAIDLLNFFPCSGLNMNVSVTLVCDGYYNCDNYEDESLCNYSATYLEEGESHFIYIPYTNTRRFYTAILLQTNATNGFQVVFQDLYLDYGDETVQIGTGNDPSDNQSVITTIHVYREYALDDVYVDTNEMWVAVIGGRQNSGTQMDVRVTAIDLLNFFACSGSNVSVSVTLVCDGYYNCDNYEDESLCNYSATYLEEGESLNISLPYTNTRRLYNATLLQTNSMNGFQVVFQDFNLNYDDEVQIGTGNDPSDNQSIITTIHGYTYYAPDDVFVDTNEMWFAVIGGRQYSGIQMDVEIISIDLPTVFACSSSNMNVSSTVLCDGLYHCDHYEDELACNYSASYLEEGESHVISLLYTNTRRLYNATSLQTNATNGFQVVFQDLYLSNYDDEVQIGTGNDPSDNQSVITTIHGHSYYAPDDVYVDTNEMWVAAIGGRQYSVIQMDVRVTAIDLLNFFPCLGTNMSVSVTLVCNGYFNCDNYEDESLCNYSATYLEEGESHYISLPSTTTRRLYNATLLQTNSTNGFQVVFQDLYLNYGNETVQIGTGNDPSDMQSVITTIHGHSYYAPDDVYVDTNEMWVAAIGGKQNSGIRMDVRVTAIDLLNFFPCLGTNMSVSVTLVCDGYFNCDNYEDESLCNYSATYLEKGESHDISIIPYTNTRRLYNVTLLQTNATNGFQVVFQFLYLDNYGVEVQIGTGNDPSKNQSVITTIHGSTCTSYEPDVYVDTNEMWFAAVGGRQYSGIQMDVEIISIDLSTIFTCSSSRNIVPVTVLCDGLYHCDHYEDELSCNYSASYLQVGDSHFISLPYTTTRRLYNATFLHTNATNGFRVVFRYLYLRNYDVEVQIGTGNDPSEIRSVFTTIHGYRDYPPDDVYIDANEMWFAVIGAKGDSNLRMDVEIISIDLSTLFDCASSNMSVSPTVLCDGLYHCDHYEDELACINSATYLEEGESHNISLPYTNTRRLYNATLLQTNATNGFQVVFRDLYLSNYDVEVQIGTGNNPSDKQSVITTIHGYTNYALDDVYVDTNEMWFAVIGPKGNSNLQMDVEIISIDLSTIFTCTSSRNIVPVTVLCDGLYHCDHYEDELACNNSATYLEEGESHNISFPYTYTRRLYNATLLQTNATNGFQVVFRNLYLNNYEVEVQIGTGNDLSKNQSVITTIHGYTNYAPDDVYVETNEMWFAVIGGKGYTSLRMDVEIISINLSIDCSGSNPCQNGGTCESYACTCALGFTGFICERVDCSGSNPCLNGGTCENIACTCAAGFNGTFCSTVDCSWRNPCQNGGTCEYSACTCAAGFNGALCSTDNENPLINVCPSDQNVTTDSGNATAVVTWTPPTATDNSVNQTLTSTHNSGEYFPLGNNTVTYTSTDSAGNTGTCTFFVVVSDDENPVINVCPSDQNVTTDSGNATAVVTWTPPTAADNSGYQTLTSTHNSGEYFPLGNNTVTYTSTDSAGNTGTCTFFVVVSDTDECSVNPSYCDSENGMCINSVGSYICSCNSGYELSNDGITCNDIEECSVNPSACDSENGLCMNSVGSYSCSCNPGYELSNDGITCNDIEECSVNPSICDSENGMCMNSAGSYSCSCKPGYELSNDGITCNGNADPCTQPNLCVNGVCSPIGQGQYECECQDHYEGMYCDEPTLPLEVSVHPSSQIVNINANVKLTCSFNNAKGYHWYKDDVLLPNSENQNPLIILSVSPSNIGYYFCRGSGRNGATLDTMPASVYVKDLTNIKVLNARFAIPFRDELYDQTSKLFRDTAFNISTYVEQGLRTSTGLEGVSVLCRAFRPGSVEADMNIFSEPTNMTALKTQKLFGVSLESLANESNGFLDSNTISVKNNAICQNISWISPRFERVKFPVGENGTWANSTGMCPFNTTRADEPIGRALCNGDGITQSQWQPVDNCGPFRNVTDILTEIAQVIISEENAGEVSQQISSVTSNIEDITSDDISFVAQITSNIVQQNLTGEEVTKSITSIVSNIAQVDTEELEAAEENGGAISKFVQAFEEQISRVEVADGEMLNIQQPYVAVQVQSVPAEDIMRGLVLSLAGSSLSDLTMSNITIDAPTQDDRDENIATRPDIIARVNIPPSVSSIISSTAPLSGSPSNGSSGYVRVNFNVFSSPALFISKSLRTLSADNEGFNRSANSPVISLSIGQGNIAALTESINFTFTTIMPGYMNPNCSFWDEEQADWSQDGCVLVSGFTSSDDEESVRCACDHLTNFAVIMDIHRNKESPADTAYNILTYIGCCISIFSLLVTLATYLWNKDLRTKQTSQIFICLCLTLLCLYTTFVIMISLDSREVQAGPCGFLTALVHYFVLSSIAWMGVEGYNTYLIIVKIFNTYIENFMVKAFLAAWGIPALIVIITGAIARDSYAHDDLCFLQFWAQIGGLLIPMSIILLINIVIFILVVRQLIRSANFAGRVKKEAKAERRETIVRVQNATCILLLLGLTWVTGYLLLIPTFSQVAQPIFIILNSFQGFLIFLLYCVRKPHIRKKWGLTCFDKFLTKEATTSSGGVSVTALSSSAGMNSNLRPGASDNYFLPTKGDNSDPMCMFNPTYDESQVEEGVIPPMNTYIQSSTEEQKKDTDRDATSADVVAVSLHLDASVPKATEGSDGVSSNTDADTVIVTLDSTDARKATEGTDDVTSTNNDAAVSLPKDAEDGTQHNERSNDAASATSDATVNLPMDSTDIKKGN